MDICREYSVPPKRAETTIPSLLESEERKSLDGLRFILSFARNMVDLYILHIIVLCYCPYCKDNNYSRAMQTFQQKKS